MDAPTIIKDIYQQFIDYFGEENVDLQSYNDTHQLMPYVDNCTYTIIVHWDTITVTNELDESIEIWDLYALTALDNAGLLKAKPLFNRSTYDLVQWKCNYMQSHISYIPKTNLKRFTDSCLGSSPIKNTIDKLKSCYDLDVWGLYCWELDKIVHIESLEGVPYHKLRNVNSFDIATAFKDFSYTDNLTIYPNKYATLIAAFIKEVISENILKFAFANGFYTLGMSSNETMLCLSNHFIKWYNREGYIRETLSKEQLYTDEVLIKTFFNGIDFLSDSIQNISLPDIVNTEMFTFKGNPVKLAIKDFGKDYKQYKFTIINPSIVNLIICSILKYINVQYGKDSNVTLAKNARIV